LTKIKKSIVLKAKYFEWKANTVDFKRKKIQLKNWKQNISCWENPLWAKIRAKHKKLFFQQKVGVF